MHSSTADVFVGREAELCQLMRAFEEAATGALRLRVLAGGAGIGKTRLLHGFCEKVQARAVLLSGGCTDQAESGLPYAPVTAALRGLVRERGTGAVVELVGTSSAADLAWLLPEFGAPRALPEVTMVRARLFEVVRLLLERLVEEGPVVWVVEDLHWADAGTRDMLRFLVANLAHLPLLLLLSCRTQRAQREPGWSSLVAELARAPGAQTLQLSGLAKAGVAAQLAGMLGHAPDPALVHAVHARGEGVPLFTQALVGADGSLRTNLSESLHGLLLCEVRTLPSPVQSLLRAASLSGRRVRPAYLAAVLDRPLADVEDGLGAALACDVLEWQDGAYTFRHELIREALERDTPPGERARLHAAHAAALEATPATDADTWVSLALARHWHLAAQPKRALAAAWRAAGEAQRAGCHEEQLDMLELVLLRWSAVSDADHALGVNRLDVLELAADAACWAAQPARGLILTEAALCAARERKDGEQVARLLLQRAPMRQQQAVPGQLEDLEAALPLTVSNAMLRAECLGQLCRAFLLRDRIEEAQVHAAELAELAVVTGNGAVALDAQLVQAMLQARQGVDAADALQAVAGRCRQFGLSWLEVLAMNTAVECHAAAGRMALAIEVGERTARRCAEVGQTGYLGAAVAQNRARALQFVGRWDEAVVLLEQALERDPPPFGRAQLLLCRAEIAVLRGEVETAQQALSAIKALPGALLSRPRALRGLEIGLQQLQGVVPTVPEVGAVLGAVCASNPQDTWPLLAQAMRLHADAGRAPPACARLLNAARSLSAAHAVDQAYAALVAAEHARTHARPGAAPWLRLAQRWASLGQPHQQAYALMRAAAVEPLRGVAATRLHEAMALATDLGAQPLVQDIAAVARHRRVDVLVEGVPVQTAAPFALTARETEVLKLLAQGQRNRQIASVLVISEKTASVHVSNILAKLDVRTRGAAAALAHRHGLTGSGETAMA